MWDTELVGRKWKKFPQAGSRAQNLNSLRGRGPPRLLLLPGSMLLGLHTPAPWHTPSTEEALAKRLLSGQVLKAPPLEPLLCCLARLCLSPAPAPHWLCDPGVVPSPSEPQFPSSHSGSHATWGAVRAQ